MNVTPRDFRKRLLAVRHDVAIALAMNPRPVDVDMLRSILELLDDLEEPLTRFVMTSEGGMRT